MDRPESVLVVGGGIAGLGTARALRQQDIECNVIERAAGWHHEGAGMYLPGNAVRASQPRVPPGWPPSPGWRCPRHLGYRHTSWDGAKACSFALSDALLIASGAAPVAYPA